MSEASLDAFVAGVELLSLDAGGVVIFMDHARIARIVAGEGVHVTGEALSRAEGDAKRLTDAGEGEFPTWEFEDRPGGRGWGRMIGTMLAAAGIDRARVPSLLATLWKHHMELNLWWLVPDGFGDAMDAVRAAGVKVVLVSNAEGKHHELFASLGIAKHFDLLVDSGSVGVEKPAPGIWKFATDRFPTPADRVLHLGDTYRTDIAGSLACGFRTGLIDPFGHYEGCYPELTRVPGVVEVARAIVRTASRVRALP